MIFRRYLVLLMLDCVFMNVGAITINVINQVQFDSLTEIISKELNHGEKRIVVSIDKGPFFFKEKHLNLVNRNYSNAVIDIRGKNTILIADGRNYMNGDNVDVKINGESSFIDMSTFKPICVWGEMQYADSLVEVIDVKTKLCKLKCEAIQSLKVPKGNNAYIDLTRWCRCIQYKVDRIEGGYIYFIANDLEYEERLSNKGYNVNGDYLFAKRMPRFRLSYTALKTGLIDVVDDKIWVGNVIDNVHLCETSNFLTVDNSSFRRISIHGIKFLGAKKTGSSLIFLKETGEMKSEIANCEFVGQKNIIINTKESNNLFFHHNKVTNNYCNGIFLDNGSANASIVNNYFENNGEDLSSNRCVTCCGDNYYIANNTFKNFGYCAVCVGQPWHWKKDCKASGVVKYNHIYYDQQHFEEAWKYTIMDSGAIYIWTQNDNAEICYNFIHDYTGMAQYSAIFCDDGASNFKIYGNVLVNTPAFHTIDARRCSSTEKGQNPMSFAIKNNICNEIYDNVLDGTIRFVGHEDKNNGCIKGRNIVLHNLDDSKPASKRETEIRNVEQSVDDVDFYYNGIKDNRVVVSKAIWTEMKATLPCFDSIKRFLAKR